MGTERERTDAEGHLVAAARRGDIAAFNRLLVPHEQTAYCVAWWLTGGQAPAIETTERAVLRAYRSLDSYNAASFRAWLLGHVLAAYRGAPGPVMPEPEARRPRAMRAVIASALGALPDEQRAALILGDIARLDYAEIAEATGQSPWQASHCLAAARAALAALLRDQGLAHQVGR
jgi:DNA-directed RNA polymerase specialized sigma24 family protein